MSATLKWFKQHQNNSGGYWEGPAINVFIQALDEDDAEARGNYIGLSNAGSCSCCGDRWGGYWEEEEPTEPQVVSYFGAEMYTRDPEAPFAMKFAMGDDTGVPLSFVVQTKEDYDAERAKQRAESEKRRAEIQP